MWLIYLWTIMVLWGQSSEEGNTPSNYDPFFDYSEMTQTEEEERDIQFFYRGQMVSVELLGGVRHWTDRLPRYVQSDLTYGFGLTYFFSLENAFYLNFLTGDYPLMLPFDTGLITGNLSISFLSFGYKKFLHTGDFEWPFFLIKPFGFIGVGNTFRSILLDQGDRVRDNTINLEVGLGFWFQTSLKSLFFWGLQTTYRYYQFYDENQVLRDPINDQPSGIVLRGDSWDVTFLIGVGF